MRRDQGTVQRVQYTVYVLHLQNFLLDDLSDAAGWGVRQSDRPAREVFDICRTGL